MKHPSVLWLSSPVVSIDSIWRIKCGNVSSVPFIQSLRDRAHLLAEAELARALRHLHHGDSPEEVLQMLAYGLTNKLTHDPTILLRNGEGLDDEDRDLMERPPTI